MRKKQKERRLKWVTKIKMKPKNKGNMDVLRVVRELQLLALRGFQFPKKCLLFAPQV